MNKRIKDNLETIKLIAAVVVIVLGGMAYFAKASDLKQVEFRLDQKIKADQIYYKQQRLWQLFDYYKTQDCEAMPEPAKTECRTLKCDIARMQPKDKG